MRCNSERQSVGWRHVLNTMLVVASDGNAYVLGCEAAFRWSKCKGLQTGNVFRASRIGQGLTVFAADPNGKATEVDLRVLNSKSLKPQQAQSRSPSGPSKPQASGTGTVTVFCGQADAEIYVDGRFVGNPPVMLDLPEGPHAFEVKSEGFTAWERKLEVHKNSAVTLNATLDKAR
jgi:PEGA domain